MGDHKIDLQDLAFFLLARQRDLGGRGNGGGNHAGVSLLVMGALGTKGRRE